MRPDTRRNSAATAPAHRANDSSMPLTKPGDRRAGPDAAGGSSTILAFDFGERFIGVAVGDDGTRLAHPLTTIESRTEAERFARIGRLIEEWRPGRLVVGEPLSLDGDRHALTDRADRFSRQLNGRFGLPVYRVDERLTSVEAQRILSEMGRGGRSDKLLVHPMAARLILEAYLSQ
jgi:putative holliday junction resolvase